MTSMNLAKNAFADPALPSLADLIERVGADEDLPSRRRSDLRSSLRCIAEVLGLPPSAVPAGPTFLRERLGSVSAASAGVSRKRLQNARSDLGFVLDRYDLSRQRTYLAPLAPEWQALWDQLDDRYHRTALSRFLRYCSAQGIAPDAVNDDVSAAYLTAMESESLIRAPRESHKTMCRVWNRLAGSIEGWPVVELSEPRYRQTYGLCWCEFPQSLQDEVEAWVRLQAGGDLFAEHGPPKPLKPSTIATQRDHLRCFASALVRCDHAVEAITSLSYLVRPVHVRQGLEWFVARYGGKPSPYVGAIAYTLRTIALHGVEMAEADRKQVVRYYQRLGSGRGSGLTRKNRDTLRQFDDTAVVQRFLAWPARAIARVMRSDRGTRAEALRVQSAVGAEFLTFVPLRLGNFAGLRIDRHLIFRSDGTLAIHVPGEEVKNGRDLDLEVPHEVAGHVRLYLDRFRPRLIEGASPWLFPGKDGGPKHITTLREQLKKAVREGAGVTMTPHQIRHIVGKLFLDQRPGEHGTVASILAHASTRTTIASYTGGETKAANRHFDEVLLGLRGQALVAQGRPRHARA